MIYTIISNINKYLPFVIKYVPTIFFFSVVLIWFLIGFHRGFRKSGILLFNSFFALTIVIILFLLLSSQQFFNKDIIKFINMIMGDNYLQNKLEVSIDRKTLTDILIEYWLKNKDVSISEVLIDSGAYITALAEAVLRVVLSIVLFLLYLLIIFILYIIYLIFFNSRKKKKKVNKDFERFKEPHSYQKRRLLGGFIGMFRGLVFSVIVLSIIGAPLYLIFYHNNNTDIIADNTQEEYSEETTLFKSISKYGNNGIYKVLNSVKDPNDVPYYLFLTDLVFEGAVDEDGVNDKIYFYSELISYRAFIDKSINLIVEYLSDDFYSAIYDGDKNAIIDCLSDVFKQEEFQEEFKLVFETFDKDTYLFNLSISLINSIINNIDDIFDDNEEIQDGLKVMFKEGYKSEYETIDDDMLVTIKLKDLIAPSDLDVILSMGFDLFNAYNNKDSDDTEFYLSVVSNISDEICKLSLFNKNKDNVNKSLRRTYAYICNRYLDSSELSAEESVYNKKYDDVSWTEEIKSLVNVIPSVINIYQNVFKDTDINNDNVIELLFNLNNDEIASDYELCKNEIINSNVLEILINSKKVKDTIKNTLSDNLETFTCPTTIDVKSTLQILDHIISDKNNQDLLNYILNNELSDSTYQIYRDALTSVFDEYVVNEVKNSNLVRAIFTSILIDKASDYIYFEDGLFEQDSSNNTIYILSSTETYNILRNLGSVFDLLYPFISSSNDFTVIDDYISSGLIDELLESYVLEGSISNLLYNSSDIKGNLIIPEGLRYTSLYDESEIKLLINSIKLLGIKIDDFNDLNFDLIYSKIKNFTNDDISNLLQSEIIYYNISDKVQNNSDDIISGLVIPNTVINSSTKQIKKDILIDFLSNILIIYEDNIETKELLKRLLKNNELFFKTSSASPIFNATYAYMLSYDESIKEELSGFEIPQSLKEKASKEALISNFSQNNSWYSEGYYINASLIDITNCNANDYNLEFDSDTIKSKLNDLIGDSYTIAGSNKIDVLYSSKIVTYNISKQILDNLSDNELLSNDVISCDLIAKNDPTIGERIVSKTDFSNLIYSINGLNIDIDSLDTLENITLSDLNAIYFDKPLSDYVFESTITRALVSVNINNILTENDMTKTNASLEYSNGNYVDIYKVKELEFILNFNNQYGDINEEVIKEITIKELINMLYGEDGGVNSYLLHNEISKETINIENVVIPSTDYDNIFKFIKPNSQILLLKTLDELGYTTLSDDIEIKNFDIKTSYTYFYQSNIIKASFPYLIDITYNGKIIDIVVEKKIITTDKDNNVLYVMPDGELKAFMGELVKLGISKSSDAITQEGVVNYATSYDISQSDIMHCFVSKIMDEYPVIRTAIMSRGFNVTSSYKECANLSTNTLQTYNLYYVNSKNA